MRQECKYADDCDREATLKVKAEFEFNGPLTGEPRTHTETNWVCFDHYYDVKDNAEGSEHSVSLQTTQI